MRDTVFIDFETFYDSKAGYTLSKMSLLEYIRDPRFRVLGCGIGFNGKNANWYSGAELKLVMEMTDWTKLTVVAHNVKFDGAILQWIYGKHPKAYVDTLSMSRAVLGCRLTAHSLANVAAYYGLEPKGFLRTDGLTELTPDQEAELAQYCIHDTDLCLQIWEKLGRYFPESQYAVMDWTIRCFIEPSFCLDTLKLDETHAVEKLRRAQIFKELGLEKSVFSSNEQFAALLKNDGYEVPYKKSPKQKNTDGTAKLIPALAVSDTGFIELQGTDDKRLEGLCEARIAAKSNLLETRSAKFLAVSKLGLFPFDLNFSGAVNTHRFSGASGAGGNPQNLPRGSALRAAVTVPPKHALVVADFANIELRIVAWLAREPKLIELLLSRDGDPYSAFASKLYHRAITKADKIERQYGKCAVLGLGYNMGPKKFILQTRSQTGLVIDQEESERVVYLYRDEYARIPALWQTLERYIPYMAKKANVKLPGMPFLEIKDGCVMLPSGLRLQYPNLRYHTEDGNMRGEWVYDSKGTVAKLYGGKLLENISQALAGEICKVAITRALAAGVNVKGQCHDEILAVVPEDRAEWGKKVLIDAMETPVQWWYALKLFAEAGYGSNWLEAKK